MSTQPGLTVWHWIRYGADPRGRFKRYAAATTLLLLVVWTLVAAYCALAPASYTSRFTLLLPAAGVSTSLQLDSLGQAVSSTTSPYSSSSLSPTEKYKRLVMAEGTLAIAADELKMSLADFPQPRITLVDQTELIIVSVNAGSAEVARDRAVALHRAFLAELDRLRRDEAGAREAAQRALLTDLEIKVDTARAALIAAQVEGGLVSSNQYDTTVDSLEALRARALSVEASLAQASAEVARLCRALGIDVAAASRALVLRSDTVFQDLLARYTQVAGELRAISGRLGARHPRRVALEADHLALVDALALRGRELTGLGHAAILRLVDLSVSDQRADLIGGLIAGEARRAGLAAEARTLADQIRQQSQLVAELATNAGSIERLSRNLKVAEAVFSSALARLDANKADYFASYPMVQTLEAAALPERASGPKRKLAVLGGVAATLMGLFSLLLAWLRQPLLDTILAGPGAAGTGPVADGAQRAEAGRNAVGGIPSARAVEAATEPAVAAELAPAHEIELTLVSEPAHA